MNLKGFKIALLFFVIVPLANADSVFSIRARPLAFATYTYGAEAFLTTEDGWFIGPTLHYFSGDDNFKLSALTNYEMGIKFGKIFQQGYPNQGWFVMGNLNFYRTTVTQFYPESVAAFSAKFSQIGEGIFAGYQWKAKLIGDHWDLRLGLGLAYKGQDIQYFNDGFGNVVPVGVRERFDPSLEFTMGYVF